MPRCPPTPSPPHHAIRPCPRSHTTPSTHALALTPCRLPTPSPPPRPSCPPFHPIRYVVALIFLLLLTDHDAALVARTRVLTHAHDAHAHALDTYVCALENPSSPSSQFDTHVHAGCLTATLNTCTLDAYCTQDASTPTRTRRAWRTS